MNRERKEEKKKREQTEKEFLWMLSNEMENVHTNKYD